MKRIAQLIVHIADLFEAEGRSLRNAVRAEGSALRKATARLGMAVAILFVIAPLAVMGICLLLGAVFLSLRDPVGISGAAAITGVVTLGVCGGLVMVFKGLTQ